MQRSEHVAMQRAGLRLLAVGMLTLVWLPVPGMAQTEVTEVWTGTWNAENLWRSVDMTILPGRPSRATFAVGTAGRKTAVKTTRFAIDDTSMTATLEYAGDKVVLQGRIRNGTMEGSLSATRGETALTEGTWSLERRLPADVTADQVLARVRQALRFPGPLAGGFTVEESQAGDDGSSSDAAWSAIVDLHGGITVSENGEETLVFDGKGAGLNRAPFGWMPSDVRMQEKVLMGEVLRSGAWLLEGVPLRFHVWKIGTEPDWRYVIDITTSRGVVPGRVIVDPATWLPQRAAAAWDRGDRSFGFAEYTEYAGCLFPGKITSGYRGREQEWRTTRVAPTGKRPGIPATTGVRYDSSASPVLQGTCAAGDEGHMFVRPNLSGADVGWFHIDTGAPFIILDTKVADELGLEVIQAMGPRSVRRLPQIQVGQLILEDQRVLVTDLSGFSTPDSSGRAGVLGGPVFEHAVVVFDYSGKELSVFSPDTFNEPVSLWQPMWVEGVPVTEATFDGVEGRFLVDTGKSGTVSFLSHAAAESGLFEGHVFHEAENETVAGTTVELATQLESFTFGGRRFEHPEVRVKLPGTTNDDIGTAAGVIGRGFFQDRRIVFDYAGGRLGFLEARR